MTDQANPLGAFLGMKDEPTSITHALVALSQEGPVYAPGGTVECLGIAEGHKVNVTSITPNEGDIYVEESSKKRCFKATFLKLLAAGIGIEWVGMKRLDGYVHPFVCSVEVKGRYRDYTGQWRAITGDAQLDLRDEAVEAHGKSGKELKRMRKKIQELTTTYAKSRCIAESGISRTQSKDAIGRPVFMAQVFRADPVDAEGAAKRLYGPDETLDTDTGEVTRNVTEQADVRDAGGGPDPALVPDNEAYGEDAGRPIAAASKGTVDTLIAKLGPWLASSDTDISDETRVYAAAERRGRARGCDGREPDLMIRVAFLADNQIDERSRLKEHDRVMDFVAHDAIERWCDLMLVGGDIYERRSTAQERQRIRDWCRLVAQFMPVFIISGNHEDPGEVAELHDVDRNIYAVEGACDEYLAGCAIVALPYPRKSWLLAGADEALGHEESDDLAREALRDVLRGFRRELEAFDGPRILLGHCTVSGSSVGPDQPPLVGKDMDLSLADLALAGSDVVCLGHIHKPQEWEDAIGVPVIYSGSPRRTAYAKGELEPKGYVVIEFGERGADGQMPVAWQRVPTPATPMHLVEYEWAAGEMVVTGGSHLPSAAQTQGAEIRLRYRVESDQREAAAAAAKLWQAHALSLGAAVVKVEEVVRQTTTARAPEIAAVRGLPDKLRGLWKHREIEMTPEREASVLSRLDAIEMEVVS